MTPMFFTERIVKNRSLSALSFQFLLFIVGDCVHWLWVWPWSVSELKQGRCDDSKRWRVDKRRIEDVRTGGGWRLKLVVGAGAAR
jgi:hypothetical protein